MHKGLILPLSMVFLLFVISIGAYCFSFWGEFSTATTEDYANFGTYINGITLPISIVITAISVGYQIRKGSETSKLERLHKEYNESVTRLSSQIEKLDSDYLNKIEQTAMSLYKKNQNALLDKDVGLFYEKYPEAIEQIGLIQLILEQIEKMDDLQYKASRARAFALVNRNKFSQLERLRFYLDSFRYETEPKTQFWVCKESMIRLRK